MKNTIEAIRSNVEQARSRTATLASDLQGGQRLLAAVMIEDLDAALVHLQQLAYYCQRERELQSAEASQLQ